MKAIIKNELRLSRKILIIWMGIILILCAFAYFEYLSLRDNLEELAELVNSFPKILVIMFGVSEGVNSTLGWYGCIYFWVTLLTNSYAVYLGVSYIAKENEQGMAEYLFTKPVSRENIVTAKFIASGCNLFLLAAFSGMCSYFTAVLPLGGVEEKSIVFTTTIGLFLTEITLFAFASVLSALVKSYKKTIRLGAGLLIVFYGIYIATEYLEIWLLNYLTPLKYFDVYAVARNGFSLSFIMLTIAIIMVALIVSRKIWSQREIGA